ncbi:hypothetical protein ACEPAG_3425 [Sanghuangporus baumii]
MSLQQRLGRFGAWITIDGKRAEEFGSGIHGRTVTCLVKSRVDAEVSIFVQEFPSTTTASARADVFIDGIHVGKSVLSPSKRPCCFAGSWIDDESLRPFIFSLAKKNDRQCLSEDAGKIEIRISEIIVLYGVDEDENIYIRPEPMQEWEPPSVVEQDEAMERHIIMLANSSKEKKYSPQWQSQHFHSEPFDCFKPEPVAIFEFIYGPEEFVSREVNKLDAKDLGTCSSDELRAPECSISRSSQDEHAGQRSSVGTPTTCRQSNKRARSCDTYDGWSSSGSDAECTRCADVGVDCVPRGGRSKIASEKKRPGDVGRAYTEKNKLKRRNQLRTARANDKRAWCESSDSDTESEGMPCSVILISDPDPVNKAHEVYDTPDVFNVETPDRIQSAHFQQDHSQNSGPSNEADNQEGASAASAVAVSAGDRNSREVEGDPFHIETSQDQRGCDREPGSAKRCSEAEPTQAAEANHVSGILRSSHSFASQLMELTTQNGQTEMTTDAIMNLVSECDRFSRRLRGSISQVKKEGKRE